MLIRVADHLYRYSATKEYDAVFKCNGKTKWVLLNTTDREIASRKPKEEIVKYKRTDPRVTVSSRNPPRSGSSPGP